MERALKWLFIVSEQKIQFYFSNGKTEARDPRRHTPELSISGAVYPVLGVWHLNVTL